MTRISISEYIPPNSKHIIVAPLNWGLGHASRSIPIIEELLQSGKVVTIASDGEALELLKEAFPQLNSARIPSYNIRYTGTTLSRIIINNALNVLKAIVSEKRAAEKLVEKLKADTIISDSRFGFRSKNAYSVIVSHQLNLKVWRGIFSKVTHYVNQYLINRFDECWIPDSKEIGLSGNLSRNEKIKKQRYIGLLSRMKHKEVQLEYDLAILLSGPETARTQLESKLISILSGSDKKIIMVRGTNNKEPLKMPANWTIIDRAGSEEMNNIVLSSRQIVSRSGYSSLMDYYVLNRGALILPTPGQEEQAYLARYLDGKHGFNRTTPENIQEKLLN